MKLTNNNEFKRVRSENYNFDFNKKTGFFARWGSTLKDDPEFAPMPEIADIEITTKCNGINNKVCPFCLPPESEITMGDDTTKNVVDIVVGDIVKSYDEKTKSFINNEVKELYERQYKGIMVIIETKNKKIKLTENHPVYVKNKGWINASNIQEGDDIIEY